MSAIRERVNVHASPAEADKSFLLPLTSSILRAQESISEPDLEASPLTHKGTQSVREKKQKKTKTPVKLCLQEAGGLKLPLSTDPCLAVSQPQCGISPRFDLGSVTRGNPPLGSRQVRLWSPWSQWLKVKGYRERVRKINLVKCCHARRNHTETLGRWENATRSRCTETHWLHGNRFVFCFFFCFFTFCDL